MYLDKNRMCKVYWKVNQIKNKKTIFLNMANVEKIKNKENSWAKKLKSNSEILLSIIFCFFIVFWKFIQSILVNKMVK